MRLSLGLGLPRAPSGASGELVAHRLLDSGGNPLFDSGGNALFVLVRV